MILPFKNQFVDPIINGSKIHTIREDKSNRWKPGNKIHFATGVRTKKYNQFHEDTCISTQDIEITTTGIIIGIRRINHKESIQLAQNDGFDSLSDFYDFFNKPFSGKIIHWTNFKY